MQIKKSYEFFLYSKSLSVLVQSSLCNINYVAFELCKETVTSDLVTVTNKMFLRKARSIKFSEFLVQLSLKAFQDESFNPLMIINYDDRLSGDKLQNSQQTGVNL